MTEKQQVILKKVYDCFGQEAVDKKKDKVCQKIKNLYDLEYVEYNEDLIRKRFNNVVYDVEKGGLENAYIIPPFSVLDTRQGYWTSRRAKWLSLGIQSEVGRGDNLLNFSKFAQIERKDYSKNGRMMGTSYAQDPLNNCGGATFKTGTSIFDPVLCELAYKWFAPEQGSVLDPFSGGSVRGIVAAMCGLRYTGIDLSDIQIEANRQQAVDILGDRPHPTWINGDSLQKLDEVDGEFDFVFSCPPYFDLEVYSDDPSDLSNMSWNGFSDSYREIIQKAVDKLKNNRFACFVVSEVRDRQSGHFVKLVNETIESFEKTGMKFYNEIILLNSVGTLPVRIHKQFGLYRKIGRVHQNILVFYKGDPKEIRNDFGIIDSSLPFEENKLKQASLF